jgi:DNA-binding Xre family transcriptional regulator
VTADKAFSRLLNLLAGQVSLRMAQRDCVRTELAEQSGVSAEQLRRLQAGEADDLTIPQIWNIAKVLGGTVAVSLAFANSGPPLPNPGVDQGAR